MSEFSSSNLFNSSYVENLQMMLRYKPAVIPQYKSTIQKDCSYLVKKIDPSYESEILSLWYKEVSNEFTERTYNGASNPNIKSSLLKYSAYVQGWLVSLTGDQSAPYPERGVTKDICEYIIHTGLTTHGAKILKALRLKAFVSRFKLEFLEVPEEVCPGINYSDLPVIEITTVSDILNPRFAIFYDSEVDDYSLGMQKVVIDEKVFSNFKYFLEEYVDTYCPEKLNLTDPVIFYYQLSGSVAIDDSDTRVKNYNIARDGFKKPSHLRGERCLIPIGPDNIRDGILLNPNELAYLQWTNYEINKIFKNTPLYTFDADPMVVQRKMNRFSEDFSTFICVDLEKEGITKPREIVLAISQILRKKYGDNELSDTLDVLFSAYEVLIRQKNYKTGIDDISSHFMLRGHGLGMANALTTVMQIGITLTSMYYLKKETYREIDFGLLSFNDDMVVGLKEDLGREYAECHFKTCEGLSLKMKRRKTFFGDTFVFCEEFSNEVFNSKGAYYRGFVNSILFARNVVQAKQLLTSVPFTHVSRLTNEMDRVIAKFGYEFYREEFKAPIAFGGWWTKKMNGVDLTFSEYKPGIEAMWSYWACKAKYGNLRKIPHPRQDVLEEDLSIYVKDRFYEPDEVNKYFDELYLLRQNIYEQQISKSLLEIFEDYRIESNIDVLPPIEIGEFIDIEEADFHINHSELHGIENYYSYYNLCRPSNYVIKERFSFLFPRYEDRLINKPFHFKNLKMNYLISYANIDISENLSSANYIYNPQGISLEEYYIDHVNVALISMCIHPSYFNKILVYKKLDKVKYKLDLYGGYLKMEHLDAMRLLKDNPHLWKLVFSYSCEEIREAINILLREKNISKPKKVIQVEKEESPISNYLTVLRVLLRMHKANLGGDPFSMYYSNQTISYLERFMNIINVHSISGLIKTDFTNNFVKNRDEILESLDKSRDFFKEIEDIVSGTILHIETFNGRLILRRDLFILEKCWEEKKTEVAEDKTTDVLDDIRDIIDDNDGDIFSFLDDM